MYLQARPILTESLQQSQFTISNKANTAILIFTHPQVLITGHFAAIEVKG
jgi:hypothetical protein